MNAGPLSVGLLLIFRSAERHAAKEKRSHNKV